MTELPPRARDIAMVFQSYALYPHMTVRQNLGYGLKVRKTSKREIAERVARAARAPRPRRAARPQARRSLGRPAPARRDGARDRARAEGVPHGRAALEPRREAPREHARSARRAAQPAGHDDDLRHARPDRGDDAGPARRGDARRADPAGRHAAGAVRAAGQPLRRRVHRLPRDEPRRSRGRGRRRALRRLRDPAARVGRAARRPSGRGHPAGGVRGRGVRRSVATAPGRRRSRSSRSSAPTRTCCSPWRNRAWR